MKKYKSGYHTYIKLEDMNDILRSVRDDNIFKGTKNVISQIVHLMMYDELKACKTEDERKAILDIPGDFVVYKRNAPRKVEYFERWANGGLYVTGNKFDCAMHFRHEGMAKGVAEKLGKDWKYMDVGAETLEISHRAYDSIMKILEENG